MSEEMIEYMFKVLPVILKNAAFVILVIMCARYLSKAVVKILNSTVKREESSVTILDNILSTIIYVMAILIVLSHFDIAITPILTAMGVGGIAIGLGLQETLQNIFAGLWLIASKQIQVGDFILLSTGQQGRVTDITWRYTTVQSMLGNLIVIPNKNLASSIITNYNLPYKDITIKIPIGVAYDSDLEQVERVTLEVADQVMHDMSEFSEIPPKVIFHTFADSSINFDVLLHSARFEMQLELKHRFIKALTARYRKEGIEIPFPIRTIIDSSPTSQK